MKCLRKYKYLNIEFHINREITFTLNESPFHFYNIGSDILKERIPKEKRSFLAHTLEEENKLIKLAIDDCIGIINFITRMEWQEFIYDSIFEDIQYRGDDPKFVSENGVINQRPNEIRRQIKKYLQEFFF